MANQLPDNDNDNQDIDEIDNYDFLYNNDGSIDNYDVASMENLMDEAFALIGTRYQRGAMGMGAFDCSGFTSYLYDQMGIKLNRTSRAQYTQGEAVDNSNLQTGDLVFFSDSVDPIGHVGMYIGNGQFVHAANSRSGVIITDLTTGYYATRGYEARRIV